MQFYSGNSVFLSLVKQEKIKIMNTAVAAVVLNERNFVFGMWRRLHVGI
jgi:hypothetical protein